MRETCIIVTRDGFEPEPIGLADLFVKLDEPISEQIAHRAGHAIPGETPEIFVDGEQGKSPGARRRKSFRCRQPTLEEHTAKLAIPFVPRTAQRRSRGPQRARMAVLRTFFFQPLAVEPHEIAKSAGLWI